MSDEHIAEIADLEDYEEIFRFVESIIRKECEFDGISIMLYDKAENSYILMPPDLQWRDIVSLPESFVGQTFEKNLPEIIDDPTSQNLCNISIDCFGEKNADSLLLFPVINKNENYDIVLSLWKIYEKEKEEVIEPLIVGSQMIGATTRVKSTIIHHSFEQKDIDLLRSLETTLIQASKKLKEQIDAQKKAIINRIQQNEQVFKTPQEIIAALINILMGTNSSLANIKDIIGQMREQIHHNDKVAPLLKQVEELVVRLDENILHTFRFATTNNIVEDIFRGKGVVDTKEFFEHFATTVKELICYKNIHIVFFLDPRLPSKIKIDKQDVYIFISELIRFVLDHNAGHLPLEIRITNNPNKPLTVLFRLIYTTNKEDLEMHRALFRNKKDRKNEIEDALYLAYNKLLQHGGEVSVDIDTEKNSVSFANSIPYELEDENPIFAPIHDPNLQIRVLLDKTSDMKTANNIARYLLSLGIKKSQLKGAEKFELFKDNITHLIVFQSQFSDDLFKNKLSQKQYRIMTVIDGCDQDKTIDFYDYSIIDMEIDQNQPYLTNLADFLQMELD